MTSRREEKDQRRQERLARERAQLDEARKRRTYAIVAGTVLAAAAIAAVIFAVAGSGGDDSTASGLGFETKAAKATDPPPQKIADLTQAAKAAGCTLRNPPIEGRIHVTKKVKYKTNPPTSGNHYPIPQQDGVYTKPPQLTHIVHTLEHGRVEIQYSPRIAPKRLSQLGGFFNEEPSYTLLFPNTKMPYMLAVTAWGHFAGCEKVTDESFDVIRAFKRRYLGAAPESLESQPTNF